MQAIQGREKKTFKCCKRVVFSVVPQCVCVRVHSPSLDLVRRRGMVQKVAFILSSPGVLFHIRYQTLLKLISRCQIIEHRI